jgi:Raf kinase inhibitor-like YbhB/YbcL family protein
LVRGVGGWGIGWDIEVARRHAMTDELLEIVVKSPAFREGDPIPAKYTADGDNVSPPLTWSGVPREAKSLVLLCEDPDAPRGTWTHWVLFNLPPQLRELPEGASTKSDALGGAVQGTNDFGNQGYGGPAPPAGKFHRYYFKLTTLNSMLNLPAGAKRADVLAAMEKHVIGEGWVMGIYQRKR